MSQRTYLGAPGKPTRIEVPGDLKGWLISHVVSSELGVDVYLIPERAPKVAVVFGEYDLEHPELTEEGCAAVIGQCESMQLRFRFPPGPR